MLQKTVTIVSQVQNKITEVCSGLILLLRNYYAWLKASKRVLMRDALVMTLLTSFFLMPALAIAEDSVPYLAAPFMIKNPRVFNVEPISYIIANPQTNEEIIWNFLIENDFSTIAAAGIMGNMRQENNFRTSDDGVSFGIAQWTGSRRQALLNHSNPQSLSTQLNFMIEELDKQAYRSIIPELAVCDSIDRATIIFQNIYERPGIPNTKNRIKYANDIYQRYAQK